MSSTGSPEASLASLRSRPRASFAPSVGGGSLDKPGASKWLHRGGGLAYKSQRKLSQRTVASTMNPRQRRLWKLQQMAVKKQQAFAEALQNIPVSEMEKVIAASAADLDRATQSYERFLMANEGKGRYLWSKLRDLMASMDAETKLRIKLLPVVPLDRDLAAAGAASGSGGGSGGSQSSSKATSPRTTQSGSKSGTPRQASRGGSKAGTPRSVAASRAGTTPRGGGGSGAAGSKLSTPRSLLRAAASNAAGAPAKIEITKRPPQTVFKWRTSNHVKLATDLPEELLRHRHNHDFDKYHRNSVLGAAAVGVGGQAAAAEEASEAGQEQWRTTGAADSRRSSGGGGPGGSAVARSRPGSHLLPQRPAPTKPAAGCSKPQLAGAGFAIAAAANLAGSKAPRVPGAAAATNKQGSGRGEGAAAAPEVAAQHYGQQWFAPPRVWATCSAARLQDEDPVVTHIEASSRLPRSSLVAKQQELQERISGTAGAQTYARHLQRTGKRLPDYLQRAIQPADAALPPQQQQQPIAARGGRKAAAGSL